ncbi:hypothetical protein CHUAL_011302 [Chamberlinius hualienensis]
MQKMNICELVRIYIRKTIKDKEKTFNAVKNAQPLALSVIRKWDGLIAHMETILKLWCDNQVKVKNYPVDQNTVLPS